MFSCVTAYRLFQRRGPVMSAIDIQLKYNWLAWYINIFCWTIQVSLDLSVYTSWNMSLSLSFSLLSLTHTYTNREREIERKTERGHEDHVVSLLCTQLPALPQGLSDRHLASEACLRWAAGSGYMKTPHWLLTLFCYSGHFQWIFNHTSNSSEERQPLHG